MNTKLLVLILGLASLITLAILINNEGTRINESEKRQRIAEVERLREQRIPHPHRASPLATPNNSSIPNHKGDEQHTGPDNKSDSSGNNTSQLGNSYVGLASWYGSKFHGRVTASGEVFDKNELTCASNMFPFGTLLVVQCLETGKTIEVRVTDRGPFEINSDGKYIPHSTRLIDLSEAAFSEISPLSRGVIEVKFWQSDR